MGHHDNDFRAVQRGAERPDFPAEGRFDRPRPQHRGRGHRHDDAAGFGWGPGGPEGGPGGASGFGGPGTRGGRGRHDGGPPPWMAGLFGGPPERGRGPRVRRGDVRSAILDVLADAQRVEEPVNGYQVIQQIAAKSQDAWRPSPGSVYPTIAQLEDEGLVETDGGRGRRTVRLTATGLAYAEEHTDELAAVWTPFTETDGRDGHGPGARGAGRGGPDVRAEIGQVMNAVWQIMTTGSEDQRAAGIAILTDTRRRLYGVLADGPDLGDGAGDTAADSGPGSGPDEAAPTGEPDA